MDYQTPTTPLNSPKEKQINFFEPFKRIRGGNDNQLFLDDVEPVSEKKLKFNDGIVEENVVMKEKKIEKKNYIDPPTENENLNLIIGNKDNDNSKKNLFLFNGCCAALKKIEYNQRSKWICRYCNILHCGGTCYCVSDILKDPVLSKYLPNCSTEFLSTLFSDSKRKSLNGKKKTLICCECIIKVNNCVQKGLDETNSNVIQQCSKLIESLKDQIKEKETYIYKLEKKCNYKSDEFIVSLCGDIRKELKTYMNKKALKATLKNAENYSLEKEAKKKKNYIFHKILTELCERDTALADSSNHVLDLMIESTFNTGCKMINLKFLSVYHLLDGLVDHFYARSDTVEKKNNHTGKGPSPSEIDSILFKESKKTSYNIKLNKGAHEKADVFVLDNNQIVQKSTKISHDKIRKQKDEKVGAITNLGTFPSLTITKESISKMKPLKYLTNDNLKSINFLDIYENSDDLSIYKKYVKNSFEKVKSVIIKENLIYKKDIIDYYDLEMRKHEEKYCSNCKKFYDSSKFICDTPKCNKERLDLLKDKLVFKEKFEECIKEVINEHVGEVEDNMKVDFDFNDENVRTIRILPGYLLNPSGKNIFKIVKKIKTLVDKYDQDVYVLIQDGSPNSTLIIQLIKQPDVFNFLHPINGIFHTRKEFLGLFFYLLNNTCPEIIDYVGWNYKHEFLENVRDMHKVTDFLRIFKLAVEKELIYDIVNSSDEEDEICSLDFDLFWDEIVQRQSQDEYVYSSVIFEFATSIMMIYDGSRIGGEEGMKIVESGQKIANKLVFMKHCHEYQKILTWSDVKNECIRLTEEEEETPKHHSLLILLRESSLLPCKNGHYEPTDARLENENRKQKRFVGCNPTKKNWRIALNLSEQLKTVSQVYIDVFGLDDRYRDSYKVDFIELCLKMQRYMRKNKFIESKIYFETLDSSGQEVSGGMGELIDELKDRNKSFLKKMIKCMIERSKIECLKKDCREIEFKRETKELNIVFSSIEDIEEEEYSPIHDKMDVENNIKTSKTFQRSQNKLGEIRIEKERQINYNDDEYYIKIGVANKKKTNYFAPPTSYNRKYHQKIDFNNLNIVVEEDIH